MRGKRGGGGATHSVDAECDAPGIGAGVYFPPQAANEDDERGYPIIPAGDSHPQNTINRAELVLILAALRHGAHMIATDSLSSMYQIKKMLRRPQDLLTHQHCQLIKEIVAEIVDRGLRTTLHKVKGHASVMKKLMQLLTRQRQEIPLTAIVRYTRTLVTTG